MEHRGDGAPWGRDGTRTRRSSGAMREALADGLSDAVGGLHPQRLPDVQRRLCFCCLTKINQAEAARRAVTVQRWQ